VTSAGEYNNNFAVVPLSAFATSMYDPDTETSYCNIAVKENPTDTIIFGSLFLQQYQAVFNSLNSTI
jgi:hypothetical protein